MITDQENWEIIKKHHVYATNTKKIFESLTKMDIVVMYLIPKQISGVYTISNLTSSKMVMFHNKKYNYYFELTPKLVPDKPKSIIKKDRFEFINKISIFKNTSHWGGVIMGKSILEITEEDYNLFKKKINNKY